MHSILWHSIVAARMTIDCAGTTIVVMDVMLVVTVGGVVVVAVEPSMHELLHRLL